MPIQLPNDAESTRYTQTGPYRFEQVFHSKSANFTGTEKQFLEAGHAYQYFQIDQHTRRVIEAE